MKRTMKVARGTGKVFLAMLCGVIIPILIWIGLGTAIVQRVRETRGKKVEVRRLGEAMNPTR